MNKKTKNITEIAEKEIRKLNKQFKKLKETINHEEGIFSGTNGLRHKRSAK